MTGGEQEALKRLHRVCADVDYAASTSTSGEKTGENSTQYTRHHLMYSYHVLSGSGFRSLVVSDGMSWNHSSVTCKLIPVLHKLCETM